ncbi:MAG: hypothetical protein ABIA04_08805 [Pseudomonadota bacterium]
MKKPTTQKIFEFDSTLTGSILLEPSDPTGIGGMVFTSGGDLVYLANGLMKLASGATEEAYYIDGLGDTIWIQYADANTVPTDAFNTAGGTTGYSLAIDGSDIIYTLGSVNYTYSADNGYEQPTYTYLIKITSDGTVTLLESIDEDGCTITVNGFNYMGENAYYLKQTYCSTTSVNKYEIIRY